MRSGHMLIYLPTEEDVRDSDYVWPLGASLASPAVDELKVADLIQPTYSDLVDPEKWCPITDTGKQASNAKELDDLDGAPARRSIVI